MKLKPGAIPLTVVYSIKLTETQRITLLKLGGPQAIRDYLDAHDVRVNNAQTKHRQDSSNSVWLSKGPDYVPVDLRGLV